MSSAVALLEAVDARQLVVHYQAIYRLRDPVVTGYEALIRWDHPELGLLLPHAFLPDDMGGGIGWVVTTFVLEEALRQCAAWRAAGHERSVSVNISPGPLCDELLPAHVAMLLERYEVPPHQLTVEVTEQRCDNDPVRMAAALRDLASCGVRLSLDDFGTGESTLSRLRELRFDEIKVDRCFIRSVATNPTDQAIVRFVSDLAGALGCTVVAEGIEDAQALLFLAELGVDAGQGFLLHHPGPPPTLADRLDLP